MRISLILFFLSITLSLFSQSGTIRGTILDAANGDPIIGANVMVTETNSGSVTDLDGKFEFSIASGVYTIQISYIGYQKYTINEISVTAGNVFIIPDILLEENSVGVEEIVVTGKAIKTTEEALLASRRSSSLMLDGISAAKMSQTGDGNAVDAAKRVTGVSVEGGKYVYVRGLGDRYIKTTLNGVDIPGLDPDRNTLQMDIFPTNLINNIIVGKNFTADLPADFTGGILNIETKDFPDEKYFNISLDAGFNPAMNLNSNYLAYKGSSTDFLGFDDGQRGLPAQAKLKNIPTPISGHSDDQVNSFIKSFNSELGTTRQKSLMDLSGSISFANQISLKKSDDGLSSNKLGYIFSLSYKNKYKYYDNVQFGEYQRRIESSENELLNATTQTGEIGEHGVLIGALGGLAYKTRNSKYRLTLMHLQNGESKAGKFEIINNAEAIGQSGYRSISDNLEYNQRSLTNVLLNGTHIFKNSNWELDWRLSPTLSKSDDPDIRKTAFTYTAVDTLFSAGAGGNPSRIWRSLSEVNGTAKVDVTKKFRFLESDAKLKFGLSQNYKQRDYEILFYDIQFFGSQNWTTNDPSQVLDPSNIFPNKPNSVYYQSGNLENNPNAYSSNVSNTGAYVSTELNFFPRFKTVLGVRAEKYLQKHTGRDQRYASGNIEEGINLENEVVLDQVDFFPSLNFIYSFNERQNLRLGYSKTIARPSFKELSFAQIIDPVTNRIFNGSMFAYEQWDGQIVPTDIQNIDLRWEYFMERGELLSVSSFYKAFSNPIELVRIPEQQTSTEYQPRNVGDGRLYGVELEIRKSLGAISAFADNLEVSGNVTFVQSFIEMTDVEYNARKGFEKQGETVSNIRQMSGQSPYVINGGISYNNYEQGINAGLYYNVKGPTLTIVGAGLFPDVYTKPFHSLNFGINKKLGKDNRTSVDFRVSNILQSTIEENYKSYGATDQIFSYFQPGIDFSLGVSIAL